MTDRDPTNPELVEEHSDEIKAQHELLGVTDELVRRFDGWALDKAEKSNGRFVAFEPGDPNYPSKIFRHHQGDPLDHTFVDMFATEAAPAYPFINQRVAELEEQTGLITHMMNHAHSGDNYVLVFPHDDLIDLALGLGAVYGHMDRLGKPDNVETAIIINAMIERLGVNVNGNFMPTIDALKIGANHILQTIPKTESARRHMGREAGDSYYGEEQSRMRRQALEFGVTQKMNYHNSRVKRKHVAPMLRDDSRGIILSVAAGGSEVLNNPEDPSKFLIRRSNNATGEMFMEGRTYVVGFATSYTRDWDPFFEMASAPRRLERPEEIHDVMAEVTDMMNLKTPEGVEYEYEQAA